MKIAQAPPLPQPNHYFFINKVVLFGLDISHNLNSYNHTATNNKFKYQAEPNNNQQAYLTTLYLSVMN